MNANQWMDPNAVLNRMLPTPFQMRHIERSRVIAKSKQRYPRLVCPADPDVEVVQDQTMESNQQGNMSSQSRTFNALLVLGHEALRLRWMLVWFVRS